MTITSNDVGTVWDKAGQIHVSIQDVRQYVSMIRVAAGLTTELNPAEDHFCVSIDTILDEMDEVGNKLSRFIKDFVQDNEMEMTNG